MIARFVCAGSPFYLMKLLSIFPGQGSQYAQMGKDVYNRFSAARAVYEEASDAVDFDLMGLSFSEQDDRIHQTRFTQPLLLCHSQACYKALEQQLGRSLTPALAAGHSLGEYTALVAANAISFSDAIKTVYRRGMLMGSSGQGHMLALSHHEALAELAQQHYCEIATINSTQQVVCGGLKSDLESLQCALSERGIKARATLLKTEGAFHTRYMVKAAMAFRQTLEDVRFSPPDTDVLSNFTGTVHSPQPETIRRNLYYQLFYPVRWLDNMRHCLTQNVDTAIEFGGGIGKSAKPMEKRPNLQSLVQRIAREQTHELSYLSAIHVDAIDQAAEALALATHTEKHTQP